MRRLRVGLRVAVVLAVVTVGLVPALPAQAGGWAVTLLDPLPAEFEADRAYTVGYWVLQHGAHAPEGEVGVTGLRLQAEDGRQLTFEGTALPEAAHYAVAIAVPAGTWRVFAVQGWFPEFELGTLTVPGGLELAPSKMQVDVGGHSHNGESATWGAVHPPGFGDDTDGAATLQDKRQEQPVRQEVRTTAAMPQPRSPVLMVLLVAGGLAVLAAGALAIRPLRRRLRG